MKLFTSITLPKAPTISYNSRLMTIGSCFAQNIGQQFKEGKFTMNTNPFGIIYNPISIVDLLSNAMKKKHFNAHSLIQNNGLWHSWMHHSCFSHIDQSIMLNEINQNLDTVHNTLKELDCLMITFGTSYTYILQETGKVVANCHKFPSNYFKKERLSVDTIYETYRCLFQQLHAFNPQLKIILTVSPIRHIRDGIIENQRSKSILLMASEQLCQQPGVSYFPAYEIMMDELRDYRFYKADMIHPNKVAIAYIWEKFRHSHLSEQTASDYQQVLKIAKGFQHKTLHFGSSAHHDFLLNQIAKAEKIMQRLPVNFSLEIQNFKKTLQLFK